MIQQKSMGGYPQLKTITPTMVNIVVKESIKPIEGVEGQYEWIENRYTPSEYVMIQEMEIEKLKTRSNEDNDIILDHEFRIMELEG